MPLPPDSTSIPIHGKWTKMDGTPETGTVTFTPVAGWVVDLAYSTIISQGSVTATLDANGEISLSLPATNDPDITGQPFTYAVVVSLSASWHRFSLSVPVTTVGTLELASVTPTH